VRIGGLWGGGSGREPGGAPWERKGEVLGRVGFLHVGYPLAVSVFSVLVFSPAHRCRRALVNSEFVFID
jgi:hypothetical protein